jgi:hypothetical protein
MLDQRQSTNADKCKKGISCLEKLDGSHFRGRIKEQPFIWHNAGIRSRSGLRSVKQKRRMSAVAARKKFLRL